MMGSGGLIIMDEDNCMVDIARFFLDFTVDESCGKCVPCRIGTRRMLEILEKIADGKGTEADLDRLEQLGKNIKRTALCGLGQTAPNPALSTMRYFRDEYLAHINEAKCPASVCKELLSITILEDKCIGCGLCAKRCPTDAISGEIKKPHVIDQEKCIKCGLCIEGCKFGAIVKR
jgi:NADP-reducing hydrogenase subunit HndC